MPSQSKPSGQLLSAAQGNGASELRSFAQAASAIKNNRMAVVHNRIESFIGSQSSVKGQPGATTDRADADRGRIGRRVTQN